MPFFLFGSSQQIDDWRLLKRFRLLRDARATAMDVLEKARIAGRSDVKYQIKGGTYSLTPIVDTNEALVEMLEKSYEVKDVPCKSCRGDGMDDVQMMTFCPDCSGTGRVKTGRPRPAFATKMPEPEAEAQNHEDERWDLL